jgi:predicted regulator of Ras-like GTPase activity (Roadblock/LC7/MglB family)
MFKEVFKNISDVKGFVAAGIYSGNGEIIASYGKEDINFKEVGGLAIELYTAAVSISDKMGIGMTNFIETHSDKFVFIHKCIVPGKGAIGILLESSGNIGLLKHQMAKEVKKLIPEFA